MRGGEEGFYGLEGHGVEGGGGVEVLVEGLVGLEGLGALGGK